MRDDNDKDYHYQYNSEMNVVVKSTSCSWFIGNFMSLLLSFDVAVCGSQFADGSPS